VPDVRVVTVSTDETSAEETPTSALHERRPDPDRNARHQRKTAVRARSSAFPPSVSQRSAEAARPAEEAWVPRSRTRKRHRQVQCRRLSSRGQVSPRPRCGADCRARSLTFLVLTMGERRKTIALQIPNSETEVLFMGRVPCECVSRHRTDHRRWCRDGPAVLDDRREHPVRPSA
jgi:hypothetical protein